MFVLCCFKMNYSFKSRAGEIIKFMTLIDVKNKISMVLCVSDLVQ